MLTIFVTVSAIGLAGIVIAGAAYYLWQENIRNRNEQGAQFRTALLRQLRKQGPASLDFDQLVEEVQVPTEVAHQETESLYRRYCQQALEDAHVTEAERRHLNSLQRSLAIPVEVAAAIEAKVKEERYRNAALDALSDGKITREEAAELERLRNCLGFGPKQASHIVGAPARDGYLTLFRRVIRDGQITAAELEELQRYRKALGMARGEANEIVRDEVLGLYRQWFTDIMQDGQVTPQEEQGLAWLRDEFGLDSLDVKVYESQLQEVKQLASYRQGDLPVRKTSKLLEGGESCHWEGTCCFQWETATQVKSAEGVLIVTSEQLVFSSPLRSFSVSPFKIVDIKVYNAALVIQSASSRGSGTYYVRGSRELEAILVGLVRRHKYQISANYSSNLSRHIPDTVRREVWQRDGGKCVKCAAMDYLEFDHIIPHAKGGASTVANVQLLCRRCNNLKSDRI